MRNGNSLIQNSNKTAMVLMLSAVKSVLLSLSMLSAFLEGCPAAMM